MSHKSEFYRLSVARKRLANSTPNRYARRVRNLSMQHKPKPNYLLKIICMIFDHRWILYRTNTLKHIGLIHLHPMAGMDAVCSRCGEIFDDAMDSHVCYVCGAHAWEPCDQNVHLVTDIMQT